MRAFLFGALALLAGSIVPVGAWSAELIMIEEPGCPWCRAWNEQIGVAYPKTEEGRRAPLRRVDLTEPWPEDLKDIRPERVTPTFILVDAGKEIARLRGYPGENFFWPLLDEMLDKLDSRQK
ncbi:transcriptional regulator [Roseibium aggregatum]|uniref:Transcriptional regulator n=1 Tax=Roseibium aggregatum TaxID=187304 RepID=A0A926P1Y8_9HYPH|nr:transcriptional regulator [Roseibium aggregatum]MBD1544982.1 transcriptional regulator [Roseibium aggregatum]